MGLSIGGFDPMKMLGNIAKQAVQGAVKAIAPTAINALKDLAGSGFDGIQKGVQNAVGKLPFGMGNLLNGLIEKFAPQLKSMGLDALGKALQGLVDKVAPRDVPGTNGQQVTTPTSQQRASNVDSEISSITNAASAASAQPTSSAASTGSASPTGSTSSAGNTLPASASTSVSGGGYGSLVAPSVRSTQAGGVPGFMNKSLDAAATPGLSSFQNGLLAKAKASGMEEKQIAQMEIQMQMENMKQLAEMFSNLSKSMAGIGNTITGNMRA
jgi:hypothetical protein